MSKGNIEIQQVELNTIASSFAALATKTSEMHAYLRKVTGNDEGEIVRNTSLESVTFALSKGIGYKSLF